MLRSTRGNVGARARALSCVMSTLTHSIASHVNRRIHQVQIAAVKEEEDPPSSRAPGCHQHGPVMSMIIGSLRGA